MQKFSIRDLLLQSFFSEYGNAVLASWKGTCNVINSALADIDSNLTVESGSAELVEVVLGVLGIFTMGWFICKKVNSINSNENCRNVGG